MNEPAQVLEESTGTEIVEFQEFEANLAEYKDRYAGVVYDLSDPKQDKQARSDRLAIGKVISKLDATHKAVKAPLKAKVDLLDGERKRIKDQLLDIQDGIKQQIAEHEAAIEAHRDELMAKVDHIKGLKEFEEKPTSHQIRARIEKAEAFVVDDSLEEFENEAGHAKLKTLDALKLLLSGALAEEQAAAEAEAKRVEAERKAQQEREERIAREAAEQARREAQEAAERAEREAAQALERERLAAEEAERARKDAERRAAEAEERSAREAEEAAQRAREEAERQQREAAERAERERLQREADQQHRDGINAEISAVLRQIPDITQDAAERIIEAVASGSVPHMRINY